MIKKEDIPFGHMKKEPVTGSFQGMRYRLWTEKQGEDGEKIIVAVVWPEPYSFEKTSEELKTKEEFPMSDSGYTEAIEWLNEQRERKKELWNMVFRKPLMEIM